MFADGGVAGISEHGWRASGAGGTYPSELCGRIVLESVPQGRASIAGEKCHRQ